MQTLGKIERIDPRDLWNNEASDFTPWLADNLEELGESLGFDIELKTTEAPVGGFSLDILAHDLSRDRLVVIENQLTSTDHDHLGKLLTYASGYDAATVVWIAPQIRDEHRQALDWLNLHSDEDTEFFGVVVEVLRIADSPPAVQFRPVAAPNDWRKEKVRSTAASAPTARGEAYRVFFQELIDELREKHRFTSAKKASPTNWYMFGSGTTGITYNPSFGQGGKCRAELYIDNGDEEWNQAVFNFFISRKAELEEAYGGPLDWDAMEGRQACRVVVHRPGSIQDPPEKLDELRRWFIEQLLQLRAVFGPIVSTAANSARP